MNEKLHTENPDNPFINIQPEDRRLLLKILYPTIDYDLIFYPDNDNEELLNELGIPTRIKSTTNYPYIITTNKELEKHLRNSVKRWYNKQKLKKLDDE